MKKIMHFILHISTNWYKFEISKRALNVIPFPLVQNCNVSHPVNACMKSKDLQISSPDFCPYLYMSRTANNSQWLVITGHFCVLTNQFFWIVQWIFARILTFSPINFFELFGEFLLEYWLSNFNFVRNWNLQTITVVSLHQLYHRLTSNKTF